MGNGEVERNMMKSRRSTRGLSPIFATLILIAIAVIAGIIVYAFATGWFASFGSQGQPASEKATVQAASGTTTTVTAFAQYISGGSPISINGAIVTKSDGTTQQGTVTATPLPITGVLTQVDITGVALDSGGSYTVTLTSSKGGTFVSPAFTVP
jgi:flagellin-like protein